MKKKAFLRGLLGFPLGIALGQVILIVLSLFWGDGRFTPCMPDLAANMGSEIGAVMLQTLFCGIIGASFAASSVIWEMDKWSIALQTGLYFAINSLAMLPTAYALHWMGHSVGGFLSYFGMFILYFAIIWAVQYFFWKRKLKRLNARLQHLAGDERAAL